MWSYGRGCESITKGLAYRIINHKHLQSRVLNVAIDISYRYNSIDKSKKIKKLKIWGTF